MTALARPGATLLVLAFQPTRFQAAIRRGFPRRGRGGVRRLGPADLVDPAPSAGLGWPMDRTAPQWYRFRLAS